MSSHVCGGEFPNCPRDQPREATLNVKRRYVPRRVPDLSFLRCNLPHFCYGPFYPAISSGQTHRCHCQLFSYSTPNPEGILTDPLQNTACVSPTASHHVYYYRHRSSPPPPHPVPCLDHWDSFHPPASLLPPPPCKGSSQHSDQRVLGTTGVRLVMSLLCSRHAMGSISPGVEANLPPQCIHRLAPRLLSILPPPLPSSLTLLQPPRAPCNVLLPTYHVSSLSRTEAP